MLHPSINPSIHQNVVPHPSNALQMYLIHSMYSMYPSYPILFIHSIAHHQVSSLHLPNMYVIHNPPPSIQVQFINFKDVHSPKMYPKTHPMHSIH
jgi:hypothetical protein